MVQEHFDLGFLLFGTYTLGTRLYRGDNHIFISVRNFGMTILVLDMQLIFGYNCPFSGNTCTIFVQHLSQASIKRYLGI